jgi:D-alanine-D-alanine ligase-like ATP-grasp enzyme
VEILKTITPQINARLIIEPEYEKTGMIIFENGKRHYFKNTTFNINPFASSEIAKDKHYTSFFLGQIGYNVPAEQTFFSDALNQKLTIKRDINDGSKYADTIGFPIIVKPNNMSKGKMVTKVYSQSEYYEIAAEIFRTADVMLVQKYYGGNDFRIVVLDDKVYAAYKREPLTVVGSGSSTISGLLMEAERELKKKGRDVAIDYDDKRFIQKLNRLGYSKSTVLPKNEILQVFDNANLSSGGMMYDYTSAIHDDFKNLAVKVTKDMGLKFCGVDIIAADITKPLKEYVVLEVNGSPGLNHFASFGEKQFEIVKEIYLNVLYLLQNNF